jgi:hypothetical protein
MKLYSQHGAQEGDKTLEGLRQQVLDGVIFSPRDVTLANLRTKLDNIAQGYPTAERLFDPQFYAVFLKNIDDARLGNLISEEYPYFETVRRQQLEREGIVREHLKSNLEFQETLNVTKLLSPNILIPGSLNSVEAVIAKNFVRLAGEVKAEIGSTKPLLVTLALSRDALLDTPELVQFLNEITLLEFPPQGFYLLVSARRAETRLDIFNSDVVARWMLLNYTFAINGFEVVNGYSDLMTPFLGAVGGAAGAFGWWTNTRTFSLDRFSPSPGGGRLPVQRYLSNALLNRIAYFELDQLRTAWPEILNDLPNDALYPPDQGSEPQRNREVIQSWEAVVKLNDELIGGEIHESLEVCSAAVDDAINNYDEVKQIIPRLDTKSNDEHLPALKQGIALFKELAELG